MSYLALAALVFALGALLALLLTPLAARLSWRLGIVDRPKGRKAHARETPLLGGLAVIPPFAALVGGGLLALALSSADGPLTGWVPALAGERERALAQAGTLGGLLLGLAVMFTTGLLDDAHKDRFPAGAKLGGQLLAALCAVLAGARLDLLGWAPLNALASVLWIATIANAMNFLDHADGLCAGTALSASLVFAYTAWTQEQHFLLLALAALAGPLAGFLVWNRPPASIFLGDAGAHSVGYLLGALTLLESYVVRDSPGYLPALLPPVVLALPLFDMASVVWIRLREGRPVYVGDRNHLHHRLTRLGMGPRAALLTACLATLALGGGAAALATARPAAAAAIVVQTFAMIGLLATLLYFGERGRAPEASAILPNLTTDTTKEQKTTSEDRATGQISAAP